MGRKLNTVFISSGVVLALFFLADRLPEFCEHILLPGFLVAAVLNGSFHDRMIPGYLLIGVVANCIFYSGLALVGAELVTRYKSRLRT
jgi:hypothetical protein